MNVAGCAWQSRTPEVLYEQRLQPFEFFHGLAGFTQIVCATVKRPNVALAFPERSCGAQRLDLLVERDIGQTSLGHVVLRVVQGNGRGLLPSKTRKDVLVSQFDKLWLTDLHVLTSHDSTERGERVTCNVTAYADAVLLS